LDRESDWRVCVTHVLILPLFSIRMACMKPGKRLKRIESLVTGGYDHIWDCCCDHGFLGAALLSAQAAPWIHFVDIVPLLMADLETRLQRFYPSESLSGSRWQSHCLDVAALPLEQYPGRHLVIIAGVGGELMAQLVTKIQQRHSGRLADFLLCPVNQPYSLRQTLINLGFYLQTESLLEENRRFYEILRVSLDSGNNGQYQPVSAVGTGIWYGQDATHDQTAAAYRDKTLRHYRRIQKGGKQDVEAVIAAYEALQLPLA
jgi:tRNA (adenine22-N1)-methyltransferase